MSVATELSTNDQVDAGNPREAPAHSPHPFRSISAANAKYPYRDNRPAKDAVGVGLSDAALGLAAAGGSTAAAEVLLDRHRARVMRLQGHLPDLGLAEAETAMRARLLAAPLTTPVVPSWLSLARRRSGRLTEVTPPTQGPWSWFASLPPTWQTAVWHHEVEGDAPGRIGVLIGGGPGRARGALTRARLAVQRLAISEHSGTACGERARCHAVRDHFERTEVPRFRHRHLADLREHARSCDDCLDLVRAVLTAHRGLGPELTRVVLGEHAGAYTSPLNRRTAVRHRGLVASDHPSSTGATGGLS